MMDMENDKQQPANRRDFFRLLGRGAITGIIAAVAAALLTRKWTNPQGLSNQKCINRSLCNGCSAFDGCQLPAAASAKQSQEKA